MYYYTMTSDPMRYVHQELATLQLQGLRTEGQAQAVALAYKAFTAHVQALLLADTKAETEAQKALNVAQIAVRAATVLTNQLGDVPEAATGTVADAFKQDPAAVQEELLYKRLRGELSDMESKGSPTHVLGLWYRANKEELGKLTTTSYRNDVYDTVRRLMAKMQP